jgi:phosphoribosylaminoimidazole-succinocarboxamide synthase
MNRCNCHLCRNNYDHRFTYEYSNDNKTVGYYFNCSANKVFLTEEDLKDPFHDKDDEAVTQLRADAIEKDEEINNLRDLIKELHEELKESRNLINAFMRYTMRFDVEGKL